MSGWPRGRRRGPLSDEHRRKIRGSRNGSARLTPRQVRRIKNRLERGASIWDLGHEYGVNHTTIWMIQQGRNWSWV